MSQERNRFKYYEVSTTAFVQAKNQQDAVLIARGRKNIPGSLLGEQGEVTRIAATEAREATANS